MMMMMMLSFRPFYNVFLFTLLTRCVRCQMISLTFELTLNFGTSFVQKTVFFNRTSKCQCSFPTFECFTYFYSVCFISYLIH